MTSDVDLLYRFGYGLHPVVERINLHVVSEENYFKITSEAHKGSA